MSPSRSHTSSEPAVPMRTRAPDRLSAMLRTCPAASAGSTVMPSVGDDCAAEAVEGVGVAATATVGEIAPRPIDAVRIVQTTAAGWKGEGAVWTP
ncbi:hypothetical protein DEJ17_03435 [Curtobacterium sp. MCSS17_011]|nr:hypothetical protein DEJ17_03435 [Curtobacterium sp. MCSS17_011]